MTPERIAELRELCEKATQIPTLSWLDAAAREALPELLDEIERLRTVINGLSEAIIAEGEAQAAAKAKLAGESS